MKITDEDLKNLYKSYVSGKTFTSRKKCPPAKDIIDAFRPESTEGQKTNIVDHITRCSHCAQEFDFVLQAMRYEKKMTQEIGQLLESGPRLRRRNQRKSIFRTRLVWRYALLFISAVLIISGSVFLLRLHDIDLLGKREDRRKDLAQVELKKPVNEASSKSSLIFEWSALEDTESYCLELFDESLRPIWKSPPLYENRLFPPDELSKELQPNRTYFWMVTVLLSNGSQADSGLGRFILKD